MIESIFPRSLFYVLPIQAGAEFIAACSVLNKASAAYGLGALFTGHGLTPMQWISNLISAFVFPLTIWGFLGVRRHRPLRTLTFTYLYSIDTCVSLGFTVYFIVYWFTVAGKAKNNPGSYTHETGKSMAVGQELAMTIVLTSVTLIVRFYFALVLISYTRILCRRTQVRSYNGKPEGSFRAKMQYYLIKPFEKFWTGQSLVVRGRSRSYGPAEVERLQPDSEL